MGVGLPALAVHPPGGGVAVRRPLMSAGRATAKRLPGGASVLAGAALSGTTDGPDTIGGWLGAVGCVTTIRGMRRGGGGATERGAARRFKAIAGGGRGGGRSRR